MSAALRLVPPPPASGPRLVDAPKAVHWSQYAGTRVYAATIGQVPLARGWIEWEGTDQAGCWVVTPKGRAAQ